MADPERPLCEHCESRWATKRFVALCGYTAVLCDSCAAEQHIAPNTGNQFTPLGQPTPKGPIIGIDPGKGKSSTAHLVTADGKKIPIHDLSIQYGISPSQEWLKKLREGPQEVTMTVDYEIVWTDELRMRMLSWVLGTYPTFRNYRLWYNSPQEIRDQLEIDAEYEAKTERGNDILFMSSFGTDDRKDIWAWHVQDQEFIILDAKRGQDTTL